jgi:hypothetical protein
MHDHGVIAYGHHKPARSLSFGVDLIKMMSERLFYRILELKIIV